MSTATAIRERPILFSGEMVRAILDGRKTQTRRVITRPHIVTEAECFDAAGCWFDRDGNCWGAEDAIELCPYGQPGDRLYVRENAQLQFIDNDYWVCWQADHEGRVIEDTDDVTLSWIENARWKTAEPGVNVTPWRPGMLVPKNLSRLWLEVTAVRVERVQDISEGDARAEGAVPLDFSGSVNGAPGRGVCFEPRLAFHWLWDSLNAKRGYSWDSNPWVWVVAFRRVEP